MKPSDLTFAAANRFRSLEGRAVAGVVVLLLSAASGLAGMFGAPQLVRPGAAPARWVQAADVDGNGLGDALFSPNAGQLELVLRQADGSWTAVSLIAAGAIAVENAVVADFDRNGLMDIAAYVQRTATDTGVRLIRQTSRGVFDTAGATHSPAGTSAATFGPMRVADVDGDGRQDVVLAWKNAASGNGMGRAGWMKGTGTDFDTPTTLFLQSFDQPTDIEAGDFDRDGDIDIAVADADIRIYAGPDFGTRTILTTTGNPGRMRCVDHDGDGWPDLLVTHEPQAGGIRLYLGSATGFYKPAGADFSSLLLDASYALAVADLNLDGFNDAVVNPNTGFTAPAIAFLGGAGSPAPLLRTPDLAGPKGGLALIDDDGDGDPDLFCATATGLERLANLLPHRAIVEVGPDTLAPAGTAPSGSTAIAGYATGDFNRDGRMDMASATASNGEIRVILNSGGTAMTSVLAGTAANARHLVAADFDHDGDTDLAAPSLSTNRVIWFENNGTGTSWTPQTIPYVISTPFGLGCGDVNLDGHPDLVTASAVNGTLHLLAGNGDGTWTGSTIVNFPSVNQIEVTDLMPGGRPEIVVRHGSAGTVSLLRYVGGWQTQSVMTPPQGGGGDGMVLADFDGNGLDDVAAGFGQTVFLSKQTASGTFSAPYLAGAGFQLPGYESGLVRSLRAADFNLDGRPEIVAAMERQIAIFPVTAADRPFLGPVVLARNSTEVQSDVAPIRFDGDAVPEIMHHSVTGNRIAATSLRVATLSIDASPAWDLAGSTSYPVQNQNGAALLKLQVTHHGWSDDAAVTLGQVRIRLLQDNAARTPLTGTQASFTFADFSLWKDIVRPAVLDAGSGDLFLSSAAVAAPDAAGRLAIPLGAPPSLTAGSSQQLFLGAMMGPMIAGFPFRVETEEGFAVGAAIPASNSSVAVEIPSVSSATAARFVAGTRTQRQGWRDHHFHIPGNLGPAADLADPDHDGLVNMIEYALGLDPTKPGGPKTEFEVFGNVFFYAFWPQDGRWDIGLTIHASPDLQVWHSLGGRTQNGTWQMTEGEVFPGLVEGNLEEQILRVDRPAGSKRFFQLGATELAP